MMLKTIFKMGSKIFCITVLMAVIFLVCSREFSARAETAFEPTKLPYAAGQRFVVAQSYHSLPTHVGKDDYAIDFTQDGCAAYGRQAVAAISGKAWIVQESGYNGGYGTQLLVLGNGNVVSRYAHLISGSITVKPGDAISQGAAIGEIGNTGLVIGTACAEHPGTHIHFAMDTEDPDGIFTAKNPEPISGYFNIQPGKWYLSDNALVSSSLPLARIVPTLIHDGEGEDNEKSESSAKEEVILQNQNTLNSEAGFSPLLHPSSSASVFGNSDDNTTTVPSVMVQPSGSQTVPEILASSSVSVPSEHSGAVSFSPILGIIPESVSSIIFQNTDTSSSATTSNMVGVASANASVLSSVPLSSSSSSLYATGFMSSTIDAASSTLAPGVSVQASLGGFVASFNSSTFAIDLSWQPPTNSPVPSTSSSIVSSFNIFKVDPSHVSDPVFIASTTAANFSYAFSQHDFSSDDYFSIQAVDDTGVVSAFATTTVAAPDSFRFIQSVDDNDSRPSWYSDNWYDLGTGFFGTITSLGMEGYVDSDSYFNSELKLQEFSDSNYTMLDHTYSISNNAPFSQATAKIVINNLKIPLKTDKYYRLTTYQTYQNRSVVLKGTDAIGTAMFDSFDPGVGGVASTYSFYPYLSVIILPEDLAIAPPVLDGVPSVSFDSADSRITVSWPSASDSDEPLVAPRYEINISDSGSFDPTKWQSVASGLSFSQDVAFPNSYIVGVRAVDDFGNSSAPILTPWNFPANYTSVPSQLDHSIIVSSGSGTQEVVFSATTTVSAIHFWTAPASGQYCCSQSYLSVYKDNAGVRGEEIPSGDPVVTLGSYSGSIGNETPYQFSSPIVFSPGSYSFVINTGPSHTTNGTLLFGSSSGGLYYKIERVTDL